MQAPRRPTEPELHPSARRPLQLLRELARPALARWRRRRLRGRLLASDDPPPTLEEPVCQAVTFEQLEGAVFRGWCAELGVEPVAHRKLWEHVYVMRVLERRGMLRPGARGLGFGVGREPLAAACAARGCEVLATDQPGTEAEGWKATGQYGGTLAALNERGLCDPDRFAERVRFAALDMRELDRLEGSEGPFDFLWSCCALEHLGTLEAGLEFVRRSLALLRPGGVAVHTTELNAASDGRTVERGQTVLYRRRDLRALADELRRGGHRLELVFHLGAREEDRRIDLPPYDAPVHLKVLHAKHVTTSFGLAIERGGDRG